MIILIHIFLILKTKIKKEAKEKYKDLFDNFVNGNLKDDHEFEKKVNGIFAEKLI